MRVQGRVFVVESLSARVVGDLLTLRYADALDAGSTPGPKDWVVRAATDDRVAHPGRDGGVGARAPRWRSCCRRRRRRASRWR